MLPTLALLLVLQGPLAPHPGDGGAAPDRVAAWTEDLMHVVETIESTHPDPFYGVPRAEFEAAVEDLFGRLADLTDDQVVVELMRLVALLSRAGRDGHAALWSFAFEHLPLQLYRFADGWFVVDARAGHEELIGTRLLSLDGVPVEEVAAALAPLATRDNDTNLVDKLAGMTTSPRALHALGLAREPTAATLGLERAGEAFEVRLAGVPGMHFRGMPAREELLWRRANESPFALEVVDDALYVRYDVVQSSDGHGLSLSRFAEDVVATFEAMELDRVLIDVRSNGGGNNGTFGPLLNALRGHEAIDRPGHLFLLIGRDTFSAAGNFVTVMERETSAILVGEPTGGAPNQYGDAVQSTLPNHPDVLLRVSSRYHEFGGPDDERLTHEPHVLVPLASADWFAGRDPVLEAALAHGR